MRHSGKGTDAAPLANFLLVGALLIAGNVFWGLAASWHSIAMGIPAVVSLIMVVLLVVVRIKQERTRRALLKNISQRSEMLEQKRQDYMKRSTAHQKRAVPQNGQTKSDGDEC
jgi:hypothetical protein